MATGVRRHPDDDLQLGRCKERQFQGAKVGALAGLLFFLGIDLTLYATTNVQNLAASLVDPLLAALLFGVSGAVIASVSRPKATA